MFKTVIPEENISRFKDLEMYPEITDEKTLRELVGEPVILENYVDNINDLFDRLIDIGVRCWNIRVDDYTKLQQILIKVKRSVDSHETYSIQFNRLIFSVAYLIPVIKFLDDIDLETFLLGGIHTQKECEKRQDIISDVLKREGFDIDDLKEVSADLAMSIKRIMIVFSHADMEILTAENIFLDHYMESEIVREINNTYYPPDVQPSEIVTQNEQKYEALKEEMMKRHNPLFENQLYAKVLKPKQIEESMVHFSLTPDLRNLIPVTQNGNGFAGGYREIPIIYAAAISARVPDLINHDEMGGSGYFSRNLMILTYGTISPTVADCGTRNKIKVVLDEVEFNMRQGMYYSENKNDIVTKVLHETDTHLIGKTLWFRSPCTCNLTTDVCHTCYGTIGGSISNLPGGFIYTTEIATSRIQHNILSAKHILKSNAVEIKFSDNFKNYFEYESSQVFPLEDKTFDVLIPENFIDEIADHFTFYIKKQKGLEPVEISEYSNLYVPDALIEKSKIVEIDDITYYKISSTKISEIADKLCDITPINIQMTKKYRDIRNLIEFNLPKMESMDEACSKLNHMTYGLIPTLAAHNDVIIGRHLCRPDNPLLRPNWLNPDEPYKIMRLRGALENTEATSVAYSFEKPYEQTHKKIFDDRNKINRVGPRSYADFIYGEIKNF
jgi:hypothetical protein